MRLLERPRSISCSTSIWRWVKPALLARVAWRGPLAIWLTPLRRMGIHYVNAAYLKDDTVDLAKPEAVMYEPMADGTLKLIAVEYITAKGPASLEGQLFNFNSAPNRYGLGPFYELHVWAWKQNPTGAFADMNPNVSCDAMKGM